MPFPDRFRLLHAWLLAMLLACALPAQAGLSVYTSWSTLPPVSAANQRHVDFDGLSLTAEASAGRLSQSSSAGDCNRWYLLFVGWVCLVGSDPGNTSVSGGVGLPGFSGSSLRLYSGVNTSGNTPTQTTITFAQPTPYVGFLWGVQFNAENTMFINLTLEDNSVVTLKNCRATWDQQCVGAYVSSNWLADVYNLLLGWLFGDAIQFHSVYVKYEPHNGKKIKKAQFLTYNCSFCGFLSSNVAQTMNIDYLTYVDAAVAPHHLRVTTNASTKSSGEDVAYTVTACGNADCSLPYTTGVSGTLAFSGASPSTASTGFTIPAGPTNSTVVTMQYQGTGTGTVSVSAHTPTPTNNPKVFCGMGVAASSGGSCAITIGAPFHHFEVTTPAASGLTCETVTYTIKACANDACSSVLATGASGTLVLAGATPVNSVGFTTNASGLATATVRTTTPGTVTASISGASPAASNALRCGSNGVASAAVGNSCVYTAMLSKLKFDVPDHIGGATQNVVVQALKSVEDGSRCGAAFASTEKSVAFTCSSQSHSGLTGSVALQGNGTGAALGSCNGSAQTHTLKFDSNGQASMTVNYAQAGQTLISAQYTGSGAEASLSMGGSDSFVTVPKTLSMVATGPFVAGNTAVTSPATLSVRALNQNDQVMTTFGNETSNPASIVVAHTGQTPTGTDATLAVASGAGQNLFIAMNPLASGVASGTLRWAEVGTLNLSATLNPGSIYSISGLTPSGSLSGVGPFVPHRFNVEVSQGSSDTCSAPFTYSGERFKVTVKALNADGAVTKNHDGRSSLSPYLAKAVTLSGASSTGAAGSLTGTAVLASDFAKGEATVRPTYTFTNKATAPASITISAAENSPGTVSSASGANGVAQVRSGRLFLSNAFGSGRTPLKVPAQLQHWSGKAWVLNSEDNCTEIPNDAVILARYLDHKGAVSASPWGNVTATGFTAVAGQGNITLSAPTGGATGTIELAVNLGDTATDASCLASHPSGGKASRVWLRAPQTNASCVGGGPFDPSARATIGVHSPETRKLMHSQDLF
jgi:MSHA biogenesis protein MshQ